MFLTPQSVTRADYQTSADIVHRSCVPVIIVACPGTTWASFWSTGSEDCDDRKPSLSHDTVRSECSNLKRTDPRPTCLKR